MDDAVPPDSPSALPVPVRLRALPSEQIPVGPAASTQLTNLPRPLTSLIGREADVAAARAMLLEDGVRLLTLTGPGGVGKTRLAVRIAEEAAGAFADGAVFVPLAAVSDPTLVLSAIAHALDIRESTGRPLRETLAAALRERRLLLVLDNFEHVTRAAGDLAALLNTCPDLTILATSRAPLSLGGERRFATTPLALPAPGDHPAMETLMTSSAITLFVDRARWVSPDFALTSHNVEAVSDICRRLDGLPLAIELAAAWIRVLPAERLLERLETRLPLLRGGTADQPARLRTMHDAIAWSYDLLEADKARLFRRLAIFAGGFTLEAAERIGSELSHRPDTPLSVLDLLAALIDKSLLQVQRESAESRIVMLETVREFALDRLTASNEDETIRRRHAAYYLAVAERMQPNHSGDRVPAASLWLLETEHSNLRVALASLIECGEAEMCLRLVSFLGQFWYQHGHWSEGRRWIERALAHAADAPVDLRAEALWNVGRLAHYQGDEEQAVPLLEAGLALSRELGGTWVTPYCLLVLGIVSVDLGRYAEGAPLLNEGHGTSAQLGYGSCQALALGHLAVAAYGQGDLSRATALGEVTLRFARARDDTFAAGLALWFLGLTACAQGSFARAGKCFTELLTVDLAEGNRDSIAQGLACFAVVAAGLGQMNAAAQLLGAAEALREVVGAALALPERRTYEQAATTARVTIGDTAFFTAWSAGRMLSLEQAVALAHEVAAATTIPDPIASTPEPPVHQGLTPRQREVLALIVAGRSDRQIADALYISRRTASHHVAAVIAKLGAGTRGEAAVLAVRDGLI